MTRLNLIARSMLALIMFSFMAAPCWAAARRQTADKPLQGFEQLPIPVIAKMSIQVMGQLGYQIVEATPESGYIFGKKPVPSDMFGRKLELKVTILAGEANRKVLRMEAATCRGCIAQAHLDPQNIMLEFFHYLNETVAQARQISTLLTPPAKASPAEMPQLAVPGAAGSDNAPPARPSLQIRRLELRPSTIRPGAPFDLEVEIAAKDPSAGERIAVEFSYSILKGDKVLLSPPPATAQVKNGTATMVEHLDGARDAGAYTIRVRVQYGSRTAEESAELRIQ